VESEKTPRERAEELMNLLVPDWRPTPRQVLWTIRIGVVLSLLFAIGHAYDVTLWDWLKLLIVPAVIAAGGLWFNQQQKRRELETAARNANDDALRAYFDQITQLILDKDLRRTKPSSEVRVLARSRTLSLLERLEPHQKRSVLRFLCEAGLIDRYSGGYFTQTISEELENGRNPVIQLAGAEFLPRPDNLTSDPPGTKLTAVDLTGAELTNANLQRVDLSASYLNSATLTGADLFGANLRYAELKGADLSGADLFDADLRDSDLSYADLSYADLRSARGVTDEELEQRAQSLEGATMPNRQKYEEWLKDKKAQGKDEKNE
jgi:Pentapeptide repeats (8 copies)